MAGAPRRSLGLLPLRGANAIGDDVPRPRLASFLFVLGAFILAVVYGIPLASTGDPLWFLPTGTSAQNLDVYWDGARTSILPGDPRYRPLMDALNAAFDSPTGIELNYGLRPSDVEALRSRGHALEAAYAGETHAHGRYPLGSFTRVLISFEGEEYARGLVFVGDERGYRAGPIRSPAAIERLRSLAEARR